MIPLPDEKPSPPFATLSLCTLLAGGFAVEVATGARIEGLLDRWALVPSRLFALYERSGAFDPAVWTPLLTSTFLHADALHLSANGLGLWLFGERVERRVGGLGSGVLFLAGGAVSGLTYAWVNPASSLPTVGASGAVATLIGIYLVGPPIGGLRAARLFPRLGSVRSISAWPVALGFIAWLLVPGDGVARAAHVGGLVFGAAVGIGLRGLEARVANDR